MARPGPPPGSSAVPDAVGHAAPGRWAAVLGAVLAGVVAGVLGTLLHGQLLVAGVVQLPLGALGALLLAGSLFLYCGLWARNVIMTAVAGAVAYVVVGMLSMSSKILILTGASDTAPTVALAGNVWLFGVLVMTLAAVAVGAVILKVGRD